MNSLNYLLSVSRNLHIPLSSHQFLTKTVPSLGPNHPASSRQLAEPLRGQSVGPNCGACVIDVTCRLGGRSLLLHFFSSSILSSKKWGGLCFISHIRLQRLDSGAPSHRHLTGAKRYVILTFLSLLIYRVSPRDYIRSGQAAAWKQCTRYKRSD